MKNLNSLIVAFTLFSFAACGGGSENDITGKWKLTGFTKNGESVELTDCDNQTTWNFTAEAAEALGDGTAVQVLKGEAPEECEYYGFDAKWTMSDGKLFVSTSRIGGMGGSSLAGLMEIVEQTPKKLVLKSMKYRLTLEKLD